MSFAVRLPVDTVPIDPGATVPCTIEIVTSGEDLERFELQVEGLDSEWTVVPVPEFSANPGETLSEKIFFKPPRTSESLAGNYPFVVKVRSLISGDSKAAQGILQIRPYNYISMEIMPKRVAVSPFHRRAAVKATIMNMGNSDHAIQLFGSDPDDDCVFEFEEEQINVGPGQQKTVEVLVGAGTSRVLASAKLYNFVLSARSTSTPNVLTSAQAQLESRAPFSPGALVGALIFALVVAFWIYATPRQPHVSLAVDRHRVFRGDKVDITWTATDATDIRLRKNGVDFLVVPANAKNFTLTADADGLLNLDAVAVRDGKDGDTSKPVVVIVDEPPPVPNPVISSCYVEGSSTVKVGEPYTLHYVVKSADRAYVGETMQAIDINVNERDLVAPTTVGSYTFHLVAETGDKVAKRAFEIQVIDPSTAVIASFDADPHVLTAPGPVTLQWQVSGATAIFVSGDDLPEQKLDPTQNQLQVNVAKDSKFELRVLDDKGRANIKYVKVFLKPPDLNPLPPDAQPPTPTTTVPSTGNP